MVVVSVLLRVVVGILGIADSTVEVAVLVVLTLEVGVVLVEVEVVEVDVVEVEVVEVEVVEVVEVEEVDVEVAYIGSLYSSAKVRCLTCFLSPV